MGPLCSVVGNREKMGENPAFSRINIYTGKTGKTFGFPPDMGVVFGRKDKGLRMVFDKKKVALRRPL